MNKKLQLTTVLSALLLLSVSGAAAVKTPSKLPTSDKIGPRGDPGNISTGNKTGPLSGIPGLGNTTLPSMPDMPSMPDLPDSASDVAKAVTNTISNAFGSVGDIAGGLGSYLSSHLPVVGSSDGDSSKPSNVTER